MCQSSLNKMTQQGFTLLETIVASAIFLLIVTLMQLMLTQYQQFETRLYEDRQIEWHAFLIATEKELQGAKDIHCTSQKITFLSKQNKSFLYEVKGNMIRKRTDKGGHQPVLLNVQSVTFSQQNQKILIRVTFDHDKTYRGEIYLQANQQATKKLQE